MLVRPACVRACVSAMAYLVNASPTTVLHVRFCKFYTLLPMTMSQRVLLLGRLTAIVTGHDDKMFDHYLVYIPLVYIPPLHIY